MASRDRRRCRVALIPSLNPTRKSIARATANRIATISKSPTIQATTTKPRISYQDISGRVPRDSDSIVCTCGVVTTQPSVG
jgi:hypothetical protein